MGDFFGIVKNACRARLRLSRFIGEYFEARRKVALEDQMRESTISPDRDRPFFFNEEEE